MSNRLPSIRYLETRGWHTQWDILTAWAVQLAYERDGLREGWIHPWGRTTKAKESRKIALKIKRLKLLAKHFDLYIGKDLAG